VKTKGQKARREKRVVSAKKRMQEHTSGFERTTLKLPDGVNFWTPKDPGTYRIEIIPYKASNNPYAEEGDYAFERTYWMHRGIGPENNSYVCLAKELKKKCPVCEYRAKLAQDPNGDEDMIKALAPKQRQLFNVFDHKHPDKGVQVWEVSHFLFGKHLDNKIKNADPEDRERYEGFANEEDGLTLRITASQETTGSNTFLEFGDIEFKERKEELDPEVFDQAVDLDACIKTLDYKELRKLLLQIDDEDAEDDAPKKGKGKKPVATDDDEDDTDGDQDDDADESDEDDDDDDDDDDDADNDESGEELAVGSMVTGKYGKQTRTGQIKKITKGNKGQRLAHVKVRGMDALWVAELSELSPLEAEDESDDDDDDTPPKKPGKKPKPAEDDDESDDDDDLDLGDDDDQDDDDDPPAKKPGKKGKGKKPVGEDDDDLPFDLDDDDDEPDPAPKDKGKGKRKVGK
jgi:hypothetical protein